MMSRRVFHMITVGLVVVGIGYLIAVAARSLPGQGDEGQFVDVSFSLPAGIQNAIVWMLMAAAGLGSLFLLLAIKKGRPEGRASWRSLYTAALWIVLLLIIYRYARPMMEEAEIALSEIDDPATTTDPGRDPTLAVASWIVSAVIAAAIAAALIRVAIVARSGDWRFDTVDPEYHESGLVTAHATPTARAEGDSPRARVINTYVDFEEESARRGHGRVGSETARRHAQRVKSKLNLEQDMVSELSAGFEAVRYSSEEVGEDTAERIESAWGRLKRRFGS